jgi:small subunit ribosomal protein S18
MAQQRRGGGPRRRRKVDFIAANHIEYVDYKDTELLERFISERGKILPRRLSCGCYAFSIEMACSWHCII